MDPLTDTLSILRPRGLLWKQLDVAGDWALPFSGHFGTVFFLITDGECVFTSGAQSARTMRPGDFALMNAPDPWRLCSTTDVASVPIDTLRAEGQGGTARFGKAGLRTRILGGGFTFANSNTDLIRHLLPPIVHIQADEPGATQLRTILDQIGEEIAARRSGEALVVERLLDILLVEIIRSGGDGQERLGLRTALTDPALAAALHAFHADIARGWTVAALARAVGVSRSVFAERFRRLVGVPPFHYILHWRMDRAKDAIGRGGATLSQIAEDIGYRSLSAFSAAFRRVEGCSPRRYASQSGKTAAGLGRRDSARL